MMSSKIITSKKYVAIFLFCVLIILALCYHSMGKKMDLACGDYCNSPLTHVCAKKSVVNRLDRMLTNYDMYLMNHKAVDGEVISDIIDIKKSILAEINDDGVVNLDIIRINNDIRFVGILGDIKVIMDPKGNYTIEKIVYERKRYQGFARGFGGSLGFRGQSTQ